MSAPGNCLTNILGFFVGLFVLLCGMWIVSNLTHGNLSSYVDVVFMLLGIYIVAKISRLSEYVGEDGLNLLLVLSGIIAILNMVYSEQFVFENYLLGGSRTSISAHVEHSLSYYRMSTIARVLEGGGSLDDLEDLNLNQYKWLYTYYSLMFIFGGDVVTHINVFNMYHLAISTIFMVLIAVRMGIKDCSTLSVVMLISLIQPILDCLFAYHRDIVGQAALAVGMYLFVCTYKNNFQNLLVLPVYAALFYSYRLQYLVVALILYFWSILKNEKRGMSFYFGIIGLLIILGVLATNFSSIFLVSFFQEDLNIKGYVEGERLSIIGNLILGLVGYFPWTQLKNDPNWSYHIFAYLQGAMNIVIVYYAIKSNRYRLGRFLSNPVYITALMFFAIAFFVAGHTTYVSVAMPFFATTISGVKYKKVFNSFMLLCAAYLALSLVYEVVGLTGSGVLS